MKGRLFISVVIACCLIMQASIINLWAQMPVTGVNSTDTTSSAVNGSVHSLYAGAGYGSNMIYLGTTMSQHNGFGYASASYGLADKFYLTATGYTIPGFYPVMAYYSLGATYNHTFNSWFDISTSLSRYNVAESLRDTLFSNFTYADATLGLDWRILYSKISVGGLFADGSQLYVQTRHSRYFETPSFANDKAFFSFDPYINILFGKMISMETSTGTTTTVSPGYKPSGRPGQGSSIIYSEVFGPIEIDFGVPISFSYDFFSLEIEPGYVIPLYSETGTTGMKGFVFMASAFFRIF